MNQSMDTEEKSLKTLEESQKTIREAEKLMQQMEVMKGNLNIKEGTGQRFLQKTKPADALLQQVEKVIEKEYASAAPGTKPKKRKRKNLMNGLLRHGRA